MKKIKHDDIVNYNRLDGDDPFVCQKAIAYTLTPSSDDPRFEDVTYYGSPNFKFTSMWKSQDNSRMRVDYDSRADNSWLEDLKNMEF